MEKETNTKENVELKESLTKQNLVEDMRKNWGDADADDYASKENDLDIAIREYFELKSEVDTKTKKLKEMNAELVDLLTEKYATKKYVGDNYSATITFKDSIKYNDETKLIELLKADETLKSYVVEAVNSKALNELIKTNDVVKTKLKESYSTTTSSALTVKKI